jgi:hypothetical protein
MTSSNTKKHLRIIPYERKIYPIYDYGPGPFHFFPKYAENIFQFFVISVWKGKYCQQFVVSATSSIPYLAGCPFSTSCLKNHKLICGGES